MAIFLLIIYTTLHCSLLGFVQWPISKVDLGLSFRQLGPLQFLERVVWKEDLPYERAREESVSTLEGIQDKGGTGGFRIGELILANRDDRFDFGIDLSVRSDSNGAALDLLHVSFNIALVCLEPDVLQPARNVIVVTDQIQWRGRTWSVNLTWLSDCRMRVLKRVQLRFTAPFLITISLLMSFSV